MTNDKVEEYFRKHRTTALNRALRAFYEAKARFERKNYPVALDFIHKGYKNLVSANLAKPISGSAYYECNIRKADEALDDFIRRMELLGEMVNEEDGFIDYTRKELEKMEKS